MVRSPLVPTAITSWLRAATTNSWPDTSDPLPHTVCHWQHRTHQVAASDDDKGPHAQILVNTHVRLLGIRGHKAVKYGHTSGLRKRGDFSRILAPDPVLSSFEEGPVPVRKDPFPNRSLEPPLELPPTMPDIS